MFSFSFELQTGYFASRLVSSWGIAELTSDMVLISWSLCFLLSNKKSMDCKIKARHLKGTEFLPSCCYTSYLLSRTPKLHNHCFSLVAIHYLLRLSHLGLLTKEASPWKRSQSVLILVGRIANISPEKCNFFSKITLFDLLWLMNIDLSASWKVWKVHPGSLTRRTK